MICIHDEPVDENHFDELHLAPQEKSKWEGGLCLYPTTLYFALP